MSVFICIYKRFAVPSAAISFNTALWLFAILALYNGAHSIGVLWVATMTVYAARSYLLQTIMFIYKLYMSCNVMHNIVWASIFRCCCCCCVLSLWLHLLDFGVHIGQAHYICVCTTLCVVRVDFNGRLPLLQQASVFAYLALAIRMFWYFLVAKAPYHAIRDGAIFVIHPYNNYAHTHTHQICTYIVLRFLHVHIQIHIYVYAFEVCIWNYSVYGYWYIFSIVASISSVPNPLCSLDWNITLPAL